MDDESFTRYREAAEAEDRQFADRIADIRRREKARLITVRQAADERIAAMERHLTAVQLLRQQYLGWD
jgi:hypothetical protein